MKQAAVLWMAGDAAMGMAGLSPVTPGQQNDYLVGYGLACMTANGLMFAFGSGQDHSNLENKFLRQLNAYGEHAANYIQFAGMAAMVVGGILPGGFEQTANLITHFADNIKTVTGSLDIGLIATGALAMAGGAIQAIGATPDRERKLIDLPASIKRADWEDVQDILTHQPPYKVAGVIYHGANAAMFFTGLHHLIAYPQEVLTNTLMITSPALYTTGNIQLSRSSKAQLNQPAPPTVM